jgi:GH18 family chitinase
MRRKGAYVLNGEYGGIMIWQLAQDATGTKSLLLAIDQVIHKKR